MKLEELAVIYMALLKLPLAQRADSDVQLSLVLLRDEIAKHMTYFTAEQVQDAFERVARA